MKYLKFTIFLDSIPLRLTIVESVQTWTDRLRPKPQRNSLLPLNGPLSEVRFRSSDTCDLIPQYYLRIIIDRRKVQFKYRYIYLVGIYHLVYRFLPRSDQVLLLRRRLSIYVAPSTNIVLPIPKRSTTPSRQSFVYLRPSSPSNTARRSCGF